MSMPPSLVWVEIDIDKQFQWLPNCQVNGQTGIRWEKGCLQSAKQCRFARLQAKQKKKTKAQPPLHFFGSSAVGKTMSFWPTAGDRT